MLNPDDSRHPYVQIADQLRAQIRAGQIAPGAQLPTTGTLAESYGVSRMTVSRALRILNEEKLIVSRQGSGVFVRTTLEEPAAEVTLTDVADQLAQVAEAVGQLGARVEQLETLLRKR